MSLTDENPMVMPVAPMGGYGNAGGFANGGEWGSWLILILFVMLFANGGGWGNQAYGGNGSFPWLLASNNQVGAGVQEGFNQAATAGALAGIQSGMNAGFANAEVAACGRAADAMRTAYENQIAAMNQNFANTQAVDGRLDAISAALASCCCQQQSATQDVKYTIATEAAATRASGKENTQTIMDKLCALELDGVKAQLAAERRENDNLRSQISALSTRAEVAQQTAALKEDNAAQTAALINRISPFPVPAYTVSNPFGGCPCNSGYGSGSGC